MESGDYRGTSWVILTDSFSHPQTFMEKSGCILQTVLGNRGGWHPYNVKALGPANVSQHFCRRIMGTCMFFLFVGLWVYLTSKGGSWRFIGFLS